MGSFVDQIKPFGALGVWASPDPLAVHGPRQADLNLYAYVSGRLLPAVDPTGLERTEPQQTPDEASKEATVGLAMAAGAWNGVVNVFAGFTHREKVAALMQDREPNPEWLAEADASFDDVRAPIPAGQKRAAALGGLLLDARLLFAGRTPARALAAETKATAASGEIASLQARSEVAAARTELAVNVDTGSAVALAARNSTRRAAVRAAIGNRQMVMKESALPELGRNKLAAGPVELARVDRFLAWVVEIQDMPRDRAMGLKTTQKVSHGRGDFRNRWWAGRPDHHVRCQICERGGVCRGAGGESRAV